MNKGVMAVLLVALGGLGVYVFMSQRDKAAEAVSPPTEAEEPAEMVRYFVPVTDEQPSIGPDDALVTIVEFSDFECVYCARMIDTLDGLRDHYGEDVRIVWRNMPADMHPHAKDAARLAMAAYARGGNAAFWKVHHALFDEIEQRLDDQALREIAGAHGLDAAGVLDGDAHTGVVEEDVDLGVKLGLPGTPVYFVNGIEVRGAIPRPMFRAIVDQELAAAKELVESGVPQAEVYAKIIEDGEREAAPLPENTKAPDLEHQSR